MPLAGAQTAEHVVVKGPQLRIAAAKPDNGLAALGQMFGLGGPGLRQ